MNPRYPIYVPSKGRVDVAATPGFLIADGLPFKIVVEPQEAEAYAARWGADRLLILPWSGDDETRRTFCAERGIENGGLVAVRNWIREHSLAGGAARHWQIDDNISCVWRRFRGRKMRCNSSAAFCCVEDFTDRYTNVGVSGLNYYMFSVNGSKMPPFYLNCHVYSFSLINNLMPHRWRLAYNDDTDLCLQVLSGGMCTVAFNAFLAWKMTTMHVSGGNTADLYQGDGRLRMARSLERMWPSVVETKRRFHRPQHVIKTAWRQFDQPLIRRPDVDWAALEGTTNNYGLQLRQVKPVKSPVIQAMLDEQLGTKRKVRKRKGAKK